MEQLSFRLEVFEGPLDLLLSLISKNKVNIYDIPISVIFDQYMNYINEANEAKLELTADFMTMAATLIYIKSKMLLPVQQDDEEEDPRDILVKMLIEYKRYKGVTEKLSKMQDPYLHTFCRAPMEPIVDKTYEKPHEPFELQDAIYNMLQNSKKKLPPPASAFKGIVGRNVVSVASKVVYILRKLIKNATAEFKDLFSESKSRSEIVATFLAVLELIRDDRIEIDSKNNLKISKDSE